MRRERGVVAWGGLQGAGVEQLIGLGGGIEREGTAGCIAMANTDIELVWSVALYGTTVGIRR